MEQTDNTKIRLFFAGVRVFAAKGYKGATVREICKAAGAANLNAVNYYFGGKEGLYKTILNALFGELGKRWDEVDEALGPDVPATDRLHKYMHVYCSLLYAEGDLSRDFTTIFLLEMVNPSAFLADSLEELVAPQTDRFLGLMRDLLGRDADEITANRCLVSTLGPLLYPAVVWPAAAGFFKAVVTDQLDEFVAHAFRFALAGIQAMKNNLHYRAGRIP